VALRPPQHRVDGDIVYVHPQDPAWNDEARQVFNANVEGFETHPVWLYGTGQTRYHLDAVLHHKDGTARASDWLDIKEATKFRLRRMSVRHFSRVHPRMLDPNDMEARVDACRYGLEEVDGPGAPRLMGREELTERDVETLGKMSDLGDALVWAIGSAAHTASLPLTDAEKKAFAS
jgi:hypothetical protein